MRLLKTGKRRVCVLVVGCHSRGQEAASRATRHSAVPALFSGGLYHNLHPNPGATAGGTSPPTITCLARPYTPFLPRASCFSSPRSPDRRRAFLISLGFPGQLVNHRHCLPRLTVWSLQPAHPCRSGWGVGRVPAGRLGHSLPSKSGWEQAEGLQLAHRRACFLPERPPGAQAPLQGVVSCEPCAGVTLVLASHLRGRTGIGTRQDCPQTQVSLAHEQSGLARPGELGFP